MGGWVTRRAVLLHVLLLVVVPACLIAFWWQLHQALAGNELSWAYTVEWPVFAIIAVVAWWQLLHEDAEERAARAERAARDVALVRTPTGRSSDDEDGSDEYAARVRAAAEAEYRSHVARRADLDGQFAPRRGQG